MQAELYLVLYALIAGTLADWACQSKTLRRMLYVVFMTTGITTCSQLGAREVMHLDGGLWAIFFTVIATRLLFRRSNYFGRGRE
ncbi:hypothetical protein P0Y43_11645 [Pseudomonas entomophila]|uniref:hypothetical protein n=1 Tax=Pseudomonas entomophila TaxID=312306 RepID=UPI0023D836B2|nr:hypothetical protein [Pseudomonas entomophila]MDF0731376.1 hypothetical protein [Pseudomonas entomophila]